jgi:acetolactate synthase-1/2/3 large subunit
MIAMVGDGTYMFSNPTACHHASEKHGLPLLTVIANNARWNAVDATARLVYPDGFMAKQEWMPTSDLRPAPAYERLVEASGGYGVAVSERGELGAALRRALDVVQQERRQAVVNVICQ